MAARQEEGWLLIPLLTGHQPGSQPGSTDAWPLGRHLPKIDCGSPEHNPPPTLVEQHRKYSKLGRLDASVSKASDSWLLLRL